MEKILLLKKGHCKGVDATIPFRLLFGNYRTYRIGKIDTAYAFEWSVEAFGRYCAESEILTITAGTKAKGLKEIRGMSVLFSSFLSISSSRKLWKRISCSVR